MEQVRVDPSIKSIVLLLTHTDSLIFLHCLYIGTSLFFLGMRCGEDMNPLSRENILTTLFCKEIADKAANMDSAITISRVVAISPVPFYNLEAAIRVDLYHNIYQDRISRNEKT